MPRATPGIRLASCAADIVEIAALHGRAPELENIAGARGLDLPALGRVAVASGQLALGVRPARWLVPAPPADASATAAPWQAPCGALGAAVDRSSGRAAGGLPRPPGRAPHRRAS